MCKGEFCGHGAGMTNSGYVGKVFEPAVGIYCVTSKDDQPRQRRLDSRVGCKDLG